MKWCLGLMGLYVLFLLTVPLFPSLFLGDQFGFEVKGKAGCMDAGAAHLGAHVEESGLESSNLFGFGSVVDSNNDGYWG